MNLRYRSFICPIVFVILLFLRLIYEFIPYYPYKPRLPLFHYNGTGYQNQVLILTPKCHSTLSTLFEKLDFPGLLIDLDILQMLENDQCELGKRRIKIGIDESLKIKDQSKLSEQFEFIRFKNSTEKDYLEFDFSDMKRAVLKNFNTISISSTSRIQIPANTVQFSNFWRRSKLVSCRNITVTRKTPPTFHLPVQKSIDSLALLRDQLLMFGIYGFLNGGTFLGWYRECSLIPHTKDLDFAVFSENFIDNIDFFDFLWSYESGFGVMRQLGMVQDSFEITVVPRGERSNILIDLFLMYREKGTDRWVGGVDGFGQKYKYFYPDFDPYCAADLHGHLFWVTCTPEQKVENEYGKDWQVDEPSSSYKWTKAKNTVKNGMFTRQQMRSDVYNWYRV